MIFYKILTHDFRSPIQGGGEPLCDGKLFPVILPRVLLDSSESTCASGWNFVSDLAQGFCIAGLWTTGRPSQVFIVEPSNDAIQRGNKWRCSQLTLRGFASQEEVEEGIRQLSINFNPVADEMFREQLAWRTALGRPHRDKVECANQLKVALATRGLDWELKELDATDYSWDARDAWDAWAARDARAALVLFYSVKMGLVAYDPYLLTSGIREAYHYGLAIAKPIGKNTLGWSFEI